jgi:hypothetical protein
MGQAKQRGSRQDRVNAAKNKVLIVAPLYPDDSTNNLKVGDWMRKENIIQHDAMIVGQAYHTHCGPLKINLLVTHNAKEAEAQQAIKMWWSLPQNKGPKFAAWIPLNDIKEMTVSGMDKVPGVQGETLGMVLEMAGFNEEFKVALDQECQRNPDFNQVFGDMIKKAAQ